MNSEGFSEDIVRKLDEINDAVIEINKLEVEHLAQQRQVAVFTRDATASLKRIYFIHRDLIDDTIEVYKKREDLQIQRELLYHLTAKYREAMLQEDEAKENVRFAERAIKSILESGSASNREVNTCSDQNMDLLMTLNDANDKVIKAQQLVNITSQERRVCQSSVDRLEAEVKDVLNKNQARVKEAIPVFKYKEELKTQLKSLKSTEERTARELECKRQKYNALFQTMNHLSVEMKSNHMVQEPIPTKAEKHDQLENDAFGDNENKTTSSYETLNVASSNTDHQENVAETYPVDTKEKLVPDTAWDDHTSIAHLENETLRQTQALIHNIIPAQEGEEEESSLEKTQATENYVHEGQGEANGLIERACSTLHQQDIVNMEIEDRTEPIIVEPTLSEQKTNTTNSSYEETNQKRVEGTTVELTPKPTMLNPVVRRQLPEDTVSRSLPGTPQEARKERSSSFQQMEGTPELRRVPATHQPPPIPVKSSDHEDVMIQPRTLRRVHNNGGKKEESHGFVMPYDDPAGLDPDHYWKEHKKTFSKLVTYFDKQSINAQDSKDKDQEGDQQLPPNELEDETQRGQKRQKDNHQKVNKQRKQENQTTQINKQEKDEPTQVNKQEEDKQIPVNKQEEDKKIQVTKQEKVKQEQKQEILKRQGDKHEKDKHVKSKHEIRPDKNMNDDNEDRASSSGHEGVTMADDRRPNITGKTVNQNNGNHKQSIKPSESKDSQEEIAETSASNTLYSTNQVSTKTVQLNGALESPVTGAATQAFGDLTTVEIPPVSEEDLVNEHDHQNLQNDQLTNHNQKGLVQHTQVLVQTHPEITLESEQRSLYTTEQLDIWHSDKREIAAAETDRQDVGQEINRQGQTTEEINREEETAQASVGHSTWESIVETTIMTSQADELKVIRDHPQADPDTVRQESTGQCEGTGSVQHHNNSSLIDIQGQCQPASYTFIDTRLEDRHSVSVTDESEPKHEEFEPSCRKEEQLLDEVEPSLKPTLAEFDTFTPDIWPGSMQVDSTRHSFTEASETTTWQPENPEKSTQEAGNPNEVEDHTTLHETWSQELSTWIQPSLIPDMLTTPISDTFSINNDPQLLEGGSEMTEIQTQTSHEHKQEEPTPNELRHQSQETVPTHYEDLLLIFD